MNKIIKWIFGVKDETRIEGNFKEGFDMSRWDYEDWLKLVIWGIVFFALFSFIFYINNNLIICRPLTCLRNSPDHTCINGTWLSNCDNRAKLDDEKSMGVISREESLMKYNKTCSYPKEPITYYYFLRFYDMRYMNDAECKYNIKIGYEVIKQTFINVFHIKLV